MRDLRFQRAHRAWLDHNAITLASHMDRSMLVNENARFARAAAVILHPPVITVADATGATDQEFNLLLTVARGFAVTHGLRLDHGNVTSGTTWRRGRSRRNVARGTALLTVKGYTLLLRDTLLGARPLARSVGASPQSQQTDRQRQDPLRQLEEPSALGLNGSKSKKNQAESAPQG